MADEIIIFELKFYYSVITLNYSFFSFSRERERTLIFFQSSRNNSSTVSFSNEKLTSYPKNNQTFLPKRIETYLNLEPETLPSDKWRAPSGGRKLPAENTDKYEPDLLLIQDIIKSVSPRSSSQL